MQAACFCWILKVCGIAEQKRMYVARICTGNLKYFKFNKILTDVKVILYKAEMKRRLKKCGKTKHRFRR